MPWGRVELPISCENMVLNHARMPVPPPRRYCLPTCPAFIAKRYSAGVPPLRHFLIIVRLPRLSSEARYCGVCQWSLSRPCVGTTKVSNKSQPAPHSPTPCQSDTGIAQKEIYRQKWLIYEKFEANTDFFSFCFIEKSDA